jgi:hypothetical protein
MESLSAGEPAGQASTSTCVRCGMVIGLGVADGLCRACRRKRPEDAANDMTVAAPSDDQMPLEPESSDGTLVLSDAAREVLDVAEALLHALDDQRTAIRAHEHGTIAAAFVTRFLVRTWNVRLAEAVQQANDLIRTIRCDARWRRGWSHPVQALKSFGIALLPTPDLFLEPPSGPDVVLVTAFSFPFGQVVSRNLGLDIRVWSALVPDEMLIRSLTHALEYWDYYLKEGHAMGLLPQETIGSEKLVVKLAGS